MDESCMVNRSTELQQGSTLLSEVTKTALTAWCHKKHKKYYLIDPSCQTSFYFILSDNMNISSYLNCKDLMQAH